MTTTDLGIPLACVPGAIPAAERAGHFALAARLVGEAARERRALAADVGGAAGAGGAEGYGFRFDVEALGDVARFVGNERRCCPFLTFALEAPAGEAALWLRLTGPAGTRAFLDAELGAAPA